MSTINKIIKKAFFAMLLAIFTTMQLYAQDLDIDNMSREDVLRMSYNELIELPLDKLMKLAEIVGVSLDELYDMVLNKELSIASKKEEKTMEAPLSTTVLTSQEIENAGATSISEVFRLIPGFIVREKTTGNYDVHIRGNDNLPPGNMMLYSANISTLVMVNGRIVYNYLFGGTFWEAIPVDVLDIDRIEVVRGPSAALYGPNAVSGVINIITKKPVSKDFKFNADVQGGSLSTIIANASASKGFGDKFSMRVSANYRTMDRFQETVYFFPTGYKDYFTVDHLEDPNPDNFGIPIKPDTTAEGYYPDPWLAQNIFGANAFLYFTPAKDVNIDLTAGMQKSEIITSMLDDSNIATARRESDSKYVQLKADAKGFNLNLGYNGGMNDASVGSYGLRMDFSNLAAGLEYQFDKVKNLTLRPGISFQQTMNDDTDYFVQQSLLVGKKDLKYFAYSFRADYLMFEKLRLIGAVRQDFYNYPDDPYLSYQLVGSFKINKNNQLRLVHSTSSNSSFVLPTHTNYDWQKIAPGDPNYPTGMFIRFDGTKDLNLPTTSMIEFGYRSRILKNIQLELEFFNIETKNLISFMPDSVHLWSTDMGQIYFIDKETNLPTLTPDPAKVMAGGYSVAPTYVHFQYENLDITSKQMGVTANLKIAIKDKAQIRLFGTYQKTDLENHYPYTSNQIITAMSESIVGAYLQQGKVIGGIRPEVSEDVENESTPQFFGGFDANYVVSPAFNVNIGGYYYSSQKYIHKFGTFDIDPKLIMTAKISYKFWRENSVYLNVRNLLGNKSQEFGFLDETGAKIYGGLRLSF